MGSGVDVAVGWGVGVEVAVGVGVGVAASSFRMVPVAVAVPRVAPLGLNKVTLSVSSGSLSVSPTTGTEMTPVV